MIKRARADTTADEGLHSPSGQRFLPWVKISYVAAGMACIVSNISHHNVGENVADASTMINRYQGRFKNSSCAPLGIYSDPDLKS